MRQSSPSCTNVLIKSEITRRPPQIECLNLKRDRWRKLKIECLNNGSEERKFALKKIENWLKCVNVNSFDKKKNVVQPGLAATNACFGNGFMWKLGNMMW